MLKKFILKIKKKENPFYTLLYNLIIGLRSLSLPVNFFTRPVFRLLYFLHVTLRNVIPIIIKTFYYEPLFRSQCEKVGKKIKLEMLPFIIGNGKIELGNNVFLSGKQDIAFTNKIVLDPVLKIGDNTEIGHGCTFAIGRSIEIGKSCFIAADVRFADNFGHSLDHLKRKNHQPPEPFSVKRILIGDDVWIGRNASIMKGVKIGDRAIIGSGAIIIKDIPADYVVTAGSVVSVPLKISAEDKDQSSDNAKAAFFPKIIMGNPAQVIGRT